MIKWCRRRLSWSNVSAALLALVTLLAAVPYEAGWVATLFPPAAKPWIFIIGAGSTAVVRLIGGDKKASESQASQQPLVQNFYTYHFGDKR